MAEQPETAPQTPPEPRNLMDRAKDEVQSWFGDAEAAARRQRDEAVGDHSGKGPASDLDPDARIVDDVSRRLTEDPSLDASRIHVEARDGSVVLAGQVTTSENRAQAENLAGAVPGVAQVDNRLLVA